MTIEQAVAILEAERVLQHADGQNDGGPEGPDYAQGTPWHTYVVEAFSVIKGDRLLRNTFDDLHFLEDYPGRII